MITYLLKSRICRDPGNIMRLVYAKIIYHAELYNVIKKICIYADIIFCKMHLAKRESTCFQPKNPLIRYRICAEILVSFRE